MKLIHQDLKKGTVKIKIENLDDMWTLSQIIDRGDLVKGRTLRKIKIGEATDRSQKVIKKPVFMALQVEKVEFQNNALRVSGKITEAPEDIPKGSFHTFNLEENDVFSIEKEHWLKFQIDKIKEACQEKKNKILVVVHDREEAYFALLKKYGFELLSQIKGTVQKKADLEKTKGNFYKDILEKIEEYEKRFELNQIIIASPAFWKEELMKENTNQEIKKKFVFATCSSVDETGINEVLKRPEVKEALKQDRFAKEINLVEEVFLQIAKNAKAAYGIKEIQNVADAGAIETLLVSDALIKEYREKDNFQILDNIMRTTEKNKGEVIIISSEHDGGKKLNGLGGIAALLRYKVSY